MMMEAWFPRKNSYGRKAGRCGCSVRCTTIFDGDPKWLELATPIARLLIDKGRTPDGDWFFSLNADGSPKKASQSIYVNAFCIYGLTEFARATGDSEALEVCLGLIQVC